MRLGAARRRLFCRLAVVVAGKTKATDDAEAANTAIETDDVAPAACPAEAAFTLFYVVVLRRMKLPAGFLMMTTVLKMVMIVLLKIISACLVPLKIPCHDLVNAQFSFVHR